jgi:hypothetical protein
MPVIRDAAARQKFINDIRLSGAHTVLGIDIADHCLGIVARTATGGPAGFGTAIECAAWVKAHGKMRYTTPPAGMCVFYGTYGQGQGHVALSSPTGYIWQNDGPVRDVINYVPRAWPVANWGLPLLGWCDPVDIWGIVAPRPTVPPVVVPPPAPAPPTPVYPPPLTGIHVASTPKGLHLAWPVVGYSTSWDVIVAGPGVYRRTTVTTPAADVTGVKGLVTVAVVPRNRFGYGQGVSRQISL